MAAPSDKRLVATHSTVHVLTSSSRNLADRLLRGGCGMSSEPMMMETDMSEANRNTYCPMYVSEADRADYPDYN